MLSNRKDEWKKYIEYAVMEELKESQEVNLACFVSRLIVSNNLQADEKMLDTIIWSLTTVGKSLSLRDYTEREQAWLELLHANKLKHFKTDQLLKMALESRCFQVLEHLYELQHNYSSIIPCYLKDPIRKSEVFNYILNYINTRERCIQEQFLVHFKELVAISSKKTSEIVTENFPELIEQFCEMLDDDLDLQYNFLSEIVMEDVKLPSPIAEKYLEQLCIKNRNAVCSYLQLCFCRNEEALKITKKHEVHAATAYLLEHSGEWLEAIELLLKHDMIEEGLNLCVRGTEHLDFEGAQTLWLILLQHKKTTEEILLRQLLHAAAPHLPPAQLFELVSNANFGDIRSLLQGILFDYAHDIQMFSTTLKLLGKDIHYGLAKSLCLNGKGVLIPNLTCDLCQKSLTFRKELDNQKSIAIWSCGHCFHRSCLRTADVSNMCPQCQLKGVLLPLIKKMPTRNQKQEYSNIQQRPDLEGHF